MGTRSSSNGRLAAALEVALGAALGLSACEPLPEIDCSTADVCPTGTACDDGTCRQLCNLPTDCPDASYRCAVGLCLPVDFPSCREATDCAQPAPCEDSAGVACVDGACRYPVRADGEQCADPAACTGGDPCQLLDGRCRDGQCVECLVDGDCRTPPTPYAECFDVTCAVDRCVYASAATRACGQPGCVNGMLAAQRLCGPDGTCPDPGGTDCAGYACDPSETACLAACTSSLDCRPAFFCAGSACVRLLGDGGDCAVFGAAACASNHCDRGICCGGGECCTTAADCLGASAQPSVCGDPTDQTGCQGTRVDTVCAGFSCALAVADDDQGCAGLEHVCSGGLAPVPCAPDADQAEPVCPSACAADADCDPSYQCQAPDCVLPPGVGQACTGSGQGTCGAGLRCENGVCCSAGALGACCADATPCINGLACAAATSSCYTRCNDLDASRCASASTSYCLDNACVSRAGDGVACAGDSECASGACADGVCCDQVCDGPCLACVGAATGDVDGVCAAVLPGQVDEAPAALCAGSTGCGAARCACDGDGVCKRDVAEPCATASECAGGACADGVCCDSPCLGPCIACDLPGAIGTCRARGSGDGRECGTCQECLGDGGACAVVAQRDEGTGCAGPTSFCCAGVCVSPGGELTTACGAGDCAGVWSCAADAARCSSHGAACGWCAADVAYEGTCSGDVSGIPCAAASGVACPACEQCVDGGAAAACSGYYGPGISDAVGQYVCPAPDRCDGVGGCGALLGETCAAPADCASGYCVGDVCCVEPCPAGDCAGGVCACAADGPEVCGDADDNDCDGFVDCQDSADCPAGAACGAPATVCSAADSCGAGACQRNDLAAGAEGSGPGCPVCADCDGAGACAAVLPGQPDLGCDVAPTPCSGADTCDGAGACNQAAYPADDAACGVIACSGWYASSGGTCYATGDLTTARCEGEGNCKDANSPDCGGGGGAAAKYTCAACKTYSPGACSGTTLGACTVNQAAGEDLWGQCAQTSAPTCQTGNCDGAGGCAANTRCWADLDGDGHGAGAVVACGPCGAGRAPNGDDCCDSDASAKPGQTGWFSTPVNGCGGYDYDCSGSAEREHRSLYAPPDTYYGTADCTGTAFLRVVETNGTCGAGGYTEAPCYTWTRHTMYEQVGPPQGCISRGPADDCTLSTPNVPVRCH